MKFVVGLLLAAPMVVCADQRSDAGQTDAEASKAVVDCQADARCGRMLDARERKMATAQASYESKSPLEKMVPWVVIVAGGWGLWYIAGRKPPKD